MSSLITAERPSDLVELDEAAGAVNTLRPLTNSLDSRKERLMTDSTANQICAICGASYEGQNASCSRSCGALLRNKRHPHKQSKRKPCSIDGCDRFAKYFGYCPKHGYRLKSNGDPNVTRPPGSPARTPEEIIRANAVRSGDCLICPSRDGKEDDGRYPKWSGGTLHRYVYESHHGPIPDGLVVRHKCDRRRCVNPDHLEIGTCADNTRDMLVRGRSSAARLLESQVTAIRQEARLGASHAGLARMYGVSRTAIINVVNGRTWRHLLPALEDS